MMVLEEEVTHPDERGLCLPGGCRRMTGPQTKDWALQTTEERGVLAPHRPGLGPTQKCPELTNQVLVLMEDLCEK